MLRLADSFTLLQDRHRTPRPDLQLGKRRSPSPLPPCLDGQEPCRTSQQLGRSSQSVYLYRKLGAALPTSHLGRTSTAGDGLNPVRSHAGRAGAVALRSGTWRCPRNPGLGACSTPHCASSCLPPSFTLACSFCCLSVSSQATFPLLLFTALDLPAHLSLPTAPRAPH